jgi:YegS/Rv2252/BmrU family lipid kinase
VARTAVLISNPVAGPAPGRRPGAEAVVAALLARGLPVTARVTAGPGDATVLAREAIDSGADLIIAHGGDGTVHEVLQAMVGGSVPLGLWPVGTANVLARELGLPRTAAALADVLAVGRTRRISVGRAGQRYFVLMAGIGADADVIRGVSPALKRLTGQGAYWLAACLRLRHWPPPRFVVEVDGREYPATFAVAANASTYAGGLMFAPHARMDDEVLDLCLFDVTSRLRFARYLAAARRGAHLGRPGVTCVTTSRARARGEPGRWVQVDGELLGPLPVDIECVPAALSLVVPR